MMTYTDCGSPIGTVRAAWSDRGWVALGMDDEEEGAFRSRVRRLTGILPCRDDAMRPRLEGLMARWFNGENPQVPLDLRFLTPFQARVLGYVASIPWGHVMTYGQVARAIGRPGSARAVGGALARNPIPLLIPCHRIIASSGKLGGFPGGGPARKAELLGREGVELHEKTVSDGRSCTFHARISNTIHPADPARGQGVLARGDNVGSGNPGNGWGTGMER